MKLISKLSIYVVVFLVHITTTMAQQREDVIYLSDGSQKKGKVVSIGDEVIKFSYTGEEVQYELKKQTVNKIVFANGREESFGNSSAVTGITPSVVASNQLAVLPFEIVSNDQALTTDAMRREIQQSCVDAIKSRGLSFQIQDPRTTNAMLAKSGIQLSDIANHVPEELAKLLGVSYVIVGAYEIENKGTSTIVTTYNDKKQEDRTKGTAVRSNNTYTSTNYNTKVLLSIYDSNGRQLFSDTRKPFMGGLDSYSGALKTLAKRITLK
ncbi:hypothetical protein [Sphingobacterium psychroaquaticum]|uniref:Uncharacterized protein n=1 Tax=Sphingobacterium psychroaquaticum TaxID=561061 RepID=A0A1X7HYP3_9SPHI|nr:hypothetical protein [Sphingobacterium psychroaquaticum]SMG06955.1 hypothetical protein SAMN05660862_0231 [Sphingobacterium psychroaquaticum]